MYSCFISYCHGQHELTKTFIDQLKGALKSYLEPLMDEEVYIDEERLKPGFNYNNALGRAICESLCMIVVYSPKYERHDYCRQEFAAMRSVEEDRRSKLGSALPREFGMIIPIIFRGDVKMLPEEIRAHTQFCDFTRFTTADTDISKNPGYVKEIEAIANQIYKLYESIRDAKVDVFSQCGLFQLPEKEKIPPWRAGAQVRSAPFPGREPAP